MCYAIHSDLATTCLYGCRLWILRGKVNITYFSLYVCYEFFFRERAYDKRATKDYIIQSQHNRGGKHQT